MKKKNKFKTDLIEQYIAAVISYHVGKESKRDIIDNGNKHCMDLEVINNNLIRLSGKVEGLKELLRKYYTKYEIGLFTDAAIYRYEVDRSIMAITSSQAYNELDDAAEDDIDDQCDEEPEEDSTVVETSDGKLRNCYKKCDDKATLYEKMVKAAVEADEPTAEDYDSQANAEAGISDESDTPYDSTSRAIYGRRYQESAREDGVTPEQMNAIDDAIQKAYEESAQ